MFRIPERQVYRTPREEASFDEAEEEATGYEGAVGLDEAGEGCDDAPEGGDEGYPAGGGDVVF